MLNHFAAHLHLRYMYNVRNRHYIASKHAEYVFSAGIEIAIAMAIKAKKNSFRAHLLLTISSGRALHCQPHGMTNGIGALIVLYNSYYLINSTALWISNEFVMLKKYKCTRR